MTTNNGAIALNATIDVTRTVPQQFRSGDGAIGLKATRVIRRQRERFPQGKPRRLLIAWSTGGSVPRSTAPSGTRSRQLRCNRARPPGRTITYHDRDDLSHHGGNWRLAERFRLRRVRRRCRRRRAARTARSDPRQGRRVRSDSRPGLASTRVRASPAGRAAASCSKPTGRERPLRRPASRWAGRSTRAATAPLGGRNLPAQPQRQHLFVGGDVPRASRRPPRRRRAHRNPRGENRSGDPRIRRSTSSGHRASGAPVARRGSRASSFITVKLPFPGSPPFLFKGRDRRPLPRAFDGSGIALTDIGRRIATITLISDRRGAH